MPSILMRYTWPGNVRELRNVIERIVIMNPHLTFERKHLPHWCTRRQPPGGGSEVPRCTRRERPMARLHPQELDENHGNVSRTAEVLGLERSHCIAR